MSNTGIRSFDSSFQKTVEWLREVKAELSLRDEEQAYVATRAVLHAVRDRLPPEEAADLGAQLPMVMRGFYYEGYRPAGKPEKIRRREEFLSKVAGELSRTNDQALDNPVRVIQAVLRVLDSRVTIGEMEDVKRSFPAELQDLWPGDDSEVGRA